MRLKEMSMEKLEELEERLHNMEEDSLYSQYSQKIAVYEAMYHHSENIGKEEGYLSYIRKKLIFHLIHYGIYLKMQYEKSEQEAERCLKKALYYDKKNPIAAYRLGFLSYKRRNYQSAVDYFQRALNSQQHYEEVGYRLNEKQLINAQLYLANSALHIAKHAYERLEELPQESQEELPRYEFSPLYERLKDNDRYLAEHAFYKINSEGSQTCSKEECEELVTHEPAHTIVLYFNDRNIKLLFNEDETTLSQEQGDILRYLLTKSSEGLPANRLALRNYFSSGITGEVNGENLRQAIRRLRTKLRNCRIPNVIETANRRGETAYYFNRSLPFVVMYRVDEGIGYL